MQTIIISLLILSLFLLIVSFILKDPYRKLQDELDQLSIQHIQEMYQIKKKLKLLEEEILINDADFQPSLTNHPPKNLMNKKNKEIHAIIKNQVLSLANQGIPIQNIAIQSSLTVEEVQSILNELSSKGDYNE